MDNVKYNFRSKGHDYLFPIESQVNPTSDNPVSSKAVYQALNQLTGVSGCSVVSKIDANDTSSALFNTNSLVSVGALIQFLKDKGLI